MWQSNGVVGSQLQLLKTVVMVEFGILVQNTYFEELVKYFPTLLRTVGFLVWIGNFQSTYCNEIYIYILQTTVGTRLF